MTAVEWLVKKLDQNFDYVADTLIEQAIAMEKEQIKDAWDNGCEDDGIIDNAEQYYNETFKSE